VDQTWEVAVSEIFRFSSSEDTIYDSVILERASTILVPLIVLSIRGPVIRTGHANDMISDEDMEFFPLEKMENGWISFPNLSM